MKQNNLLLSLLPVLVAAGPGINPNPNPSFDPSTTRGTFGPFIIPQAPSRAATGGPTGPVDVRTLQAMQLAISNWATDTGIVSGFQNIGGQVTNNDAFKGIADGAFKAEVDELSQKAVLDQVIGNDPRVSLANLTLTNGVFQSVVDNLQIMSIQGQNKANLIDAINQVRCTQILPSIDTYMIVAAEYIGDNAQQRRAVRPTACAGILAANAGNSSAFPAVPGTPGGTPVGAGDGIIQGVPNACGMGAGISTATNGTTGAGNGSNGNGGNSNTSNGGNSTMNNGGNSNTSNGGSSNTNNGGNSNTNNGDNSNTNNGGNSNPDSGGSSNTNNGTTTTPTNPNSSGNTNNQGGSGSNNSNSGIGKSGSSSNSAPILPPLNFPTTPQLGLPGFTGNAAISPSVPASTPSAAPQSGNTQAGAGGKGKTSTGRFGGGYHYRG